MIRYKYIILYLLITSGYSAMAENPREILTAMNKSYLKLAGYHVQFNYQLYTDNKAATPIETMRGELYRAQNSYRFKISDAEYVRNDKYMLAIDHSKKLIILNKSSVQEPTPLSFVDTVMANYRYAITSVAGDKEMYHFILTPPSDEAEDYERVDLYISRKGLDIHKIVLYLNEQQEGDAENDVNDKTISLKKPRIEIEYLNLTKNPTLEPTVFSERQYLMPGKNGKLVQMPKYQGYKLFNQL